jgi:hypothetical protein
LGDRRQTRATPFYAALDQERTIARAINNGVNYFDNPVQ